ncbi:MAG: tRNA 2-thiouridine(34) synthase MnmA [Oscillospiraceae bacterium]|nr:tRNA 2-thiouridine(34) synthase MnmA [Oscillospiraceae bacterium]
MNDKTNSALIAMSGGVDSSVAALLIKQQGFNCTGATMKLFSSEDIGVNRESGCCSLADADDARAVATGLGMPFYVFNFTADFKNQVIGRFIEAYQNGLTPNPCIDCNRYLKFERLLNRAKQLGIDYMVTGHYSQIEHDKTGGRYLLKKGKDSSKDQSYVLYSMSQEQLKRTLFPLGGLCKSEVREIALEHGFVNAKKQDSQDICFVPKTENLSYTDFITQYSGKEPVKGRFIDINGKDLGEHKGIIHYTVGQRKGLGLTSESPLYVCALNPEANSVVVGTNEHLYSRVLIARDINLIAYERLNSALNVRAKVRYNQPEQPATIQQLDSDILRIEFDEPQRAITKGQAVVIYDGEIIIGGGTITEVL